MNGRYLMERGWQDHPLFDGEPYSLRDAWEWLIANACYKEVRKQINGKFVKLARGQLSYSLRFLAEKFMWNKPKVERFIKKLKSETMIETETDTGQLIITICNYHEYQTLEIESETVIRTDIETQVRHERDTSETKNNKGNKYKENDIPKGISQKKEKSPSLPDWLPLEDWNDFLAMRKQLKRPPTERAKQLLLGELEKLRASGQDPGLVIQQSIKHGWQSFFEVKGNEKNRRDKQQRAISADASTGAGSAVADKPTWKSEAERIAAKFLAEGVRAAGQGAVDDGAGENLRNAEGLRQDGD